MGHDSSHSVKCYDYLNKICPSWNGPKKCSECWPLPNQTTFYSKITTKTTKKIYMHLIVPPHFGSSVLLNTIASSPMVSTMCQQNTWQCEPKSILEKNGLLDTNFSAIHEFYHSSNIWDNFSKPILVEKEPENYFKFQKLLQYYKTTNKTVKFIVMLKHPCRKNWYPNLHAATSQIFSEHRNNLIFIDYDDLLMNTAMVMNKILDFIPELAELNINSYNLNEKTTRAAALGKIKHGGLHSHSLLDYIQSERCVLKSSGRKYVNIDWPLRADSTCPYSPMKTRYLYDKYKNYALGDVFSGWYFVVRMGVNNISRTQLLEMYKQYGKNIVSEYYTTIRTPNNISTMYNKIIKPKLLTNIDEKAAVLHVRSGDVMGWCLYRPCKSCWNCIGSKKREWWRKKVLPKSYYEKMIQRLKKHDINSIIIVLSTYHTMVKLNLEQVYKLSMTYITHLKDFLTGHGYKVRYRIDCGTPDEDLIFMASHKYFIQGGGGFSAIVSELVRLNGGHVFYNRSVIKKYLQQICDASKKEYAFFDKTGLEMERCEETMQKYMKTTNPKLRKPVVKKSELKQRAGKKSQLKSKWISMMLMLGLVGVVMKRKRCSKWFGGNCTYYQKVNTI